MSYFSRKSRFLNNIPIIQTQQDGSFHYSLLFQYELVPAKEMSRMRTTREIIAYYQNLIAYDSLLPPSLNSWYDEIKTKKGQVQLLKSSLSQ